MSRRRSAAAAAAPLPLAEPLASLKPTGRRNAAVLGRADRSALAAVVGYVDALEGLLSSVSPLVRARAADELRRLT